MTCVCVCVQEERQSLLQKLHQDVEDVRVTMHENLIRAEDRRGILDELHQRADRLQDFVRVIFFLETVRIISHGYRSHVPALI